MGKIKIKLKKSFGWLLNKLHSPEKIMMEKLNKKIGYPYFI